jgi:hypothetical protein
MKRTTKQLALSKETLRHLRGGDGELETSPLFISGPPHLCSEATYGYSWIAICTRSCPSEPSG